MSQQVFNKNRRPESQPPHSDMMFSVPRTYSALPFQDSCDGLPALHQTQYFIPGDNFDNMPYSFSATPSAPQATIPFAQSTQSTYQFPPSTECFSQNHSAMDTEYHEEENWYDRGTEPHSFVFCEGPRSYDPRDLTLSSDRPSTSPVHGDILPSNGFGSPVSSGAIEMNRLSIADVARDMVPSLEDFDSKLDMASDLDSSKQSDDEEIDINDPTDTTGDRISDEPYAKLIYRALFEAPDHAMALQDIYQWFAENTDKVKPGMNGWRNSIRHNLSMNVAFKKQDPKPMGDDSKKSSIWVLDRKALHHGGVDPTTRYRKKSCKKGLKSQSATRARRTTGGRHASRSKSQQAQHEGSYEWPAYISNRTFQHSLDNSRHSSALPDSRHLSPSTPTGYDMLPGPSPYLNKPTPFYDIEDPSHYSFSEVQSAFPDDTSRVLCGDGFDMGQWHPRFEY